MSLQIRQSQPDPATTVLTLGGRLQMGPSCVALEQEIEQAVNGNGQRLIFELSALTHMDSTGMGRLILAHQQLKLSGKTMAVVGAQGGVREMLRITQLDTVFSLYPNLGEALAS